MLPPLDVDESATYPRFRATGADLWISRPDILDSMTLRAVGQDTIEVRWRIS